MGAQERQRGSWMGCTRAVLWARGGPAVRRSGSWMHGLRAARRVGPQWARRRTDGLHAARRVAHGSPQNNAVAGWVAHGAVLWARNGPVVEWAAHGGDLWARNALTKERRTQWLEAWKRPGLVGRQRACDGCVLNFINFSKYQGRLGRVFAGKW